MKELEIMQVFCLQLLKELETGKLSGEENGWLTSDEVRKHFDDRKGNEFGYTESDSGN